MLYVHIPYCHRKCTYCAFYSAVTAADKQQYVDALCRELEWRRGEMAHPLRTVYLGGGTPTILTVAQLRQIVDAIKANYDVSQVEEATIEANPEDLTAEFLEALVGIGFFNRVSIGVQSFRDEDLRLLNRRHSAKQSREAVARVFEAGIGNISIDLIYGLPGQDLTAWRANLAAAATLPVSHLSAYALTVEPGTMLQRQIEAGRVVPADEEAVVAHYQELLAWAKEQGFEQYEISNFARQGCRSRHNSRYWDRTPYLGVGAAAHSFDGHARRWNVADERQYVAGIRQGEVPFERETLTEADAFNEYVMTALRTCEGIAKASVPPAYTARLACDIRRYVAAGLIQETATHYCPTAEGLLHADGIASELFAE